MFSKMVVSILGLRGGNLEVAGSGFIIDNLLITAAHIFYSEYGRQYQDFNININSTNYKLPTSIYKEYKEYSQYSINDNIFNDLIIFILDNIIIPKSELILAFDSEIDDEIVMKGFSDTVEKADTTSGRILNTDVAHRYFSETNLSIKFCNCFEILRCCKGGNSGGPVLKNNKVYGMILSGDPNFGCTALKSKYILEKIIENK